jgi:glyoxylase-like metal-dependent hydrolase (beta-lactamase superfamily II)
MVASNVRELGRNRLLLDLGFRDTEGLVASYLLPLPDSGWAVIETGPASCRELLARGLDRAGISRDQVRQVFVTHIHLDHAGGMGVVAEMFPQATLYAHALGVPHMIDPSKLIASARRAWGAAADPLWGPIVPVPADRIVPLHGGERFPLEGGELEIIDTPGHAKHHLALFDTGTQGLCSGDGAGVRLEGSSRARPAVPPPDLDVELLIESVERMRALAPRSIYYSHFGPSSGGAEELQEYVGTVRAWTDRALAAARASPSEPAIADALRAYEQETRDQQGAKVGEGDSGELVSGYDLAAKGFLRYFRTHGLIPAE